MRAGPPRKQNTPDPTPTQTLHTNDPTLYLNRPHNYPGPRAQPAAGEEDFGVFHAKHRFSTHFTVRDGSSEQAVRTGIEIVGLDPRKKFLRYFSLHGDGLRMAGPMGPPCFLVFVFSSPPAHFKRPAPPLNENSISLRPAAQRCTFDARHAGLHFEASTSP